tara:strand:+ start:418 stop:528 length:111 start_codon:yes stop_codon:yes gene_type:complete
MKIEKTFTKAYIAKNAIVSNVILTNKKGLQDEKKKK